MILEVEQLRKRIIDKKTVQIENMENWVKHFTEAQEIIFTILKLEYNYEFEHEEKKETVTTS